MALLLWGLHMTWQEKDSWLSILGPIHMTGVPQRRQAAGRAGPGAGRWIIAQFDGPKSDQRTVNKSPGAEMKRKKGNIQLTDPANVLEA